MIWICVSINPHFLHYHDKEELTDLFYEIFKFDYIEHYLMDEEDGEKDYEFDRYVFVHCKQYKPYISELRKNRYIKNVLNSFDDISPIPEKEIFEIKTTASNVVFDDDYFVNRTGFLLFGDIVKVLDGSLSSMNGVVIKECEKKKDFYYVYFRLFVDSFYKKIHISNLEFKTSIFKFIKNPVIKGTVTKSDKIIKEKIKKYKKLKEKNAQKKLIENSLNEEEMIAKNGESCDVVDLIKGILNE